MSSFSFLASYKKNIIDPGTEIFLSTICDLVRYFNLLLVIPSFGRNNRSIKYHPSLKKWKKHI